MSATAQLIFVGTSSNTKNTNRGIYAVRFDAATGALGEAGLAAETPNPGFLARHPGGRVIYSSGEAGRVTERAAAGAANAYTFDPVSGSLALLNQQPTGGLSVTHLVADATERMLITVSYHGGQIVAFPLGTDGRLGARTSALVSAGQLGPNPARQDKPHPHSVTLSPDNRFACVCDLGRDRILCYRLDPAGATLTPAGEFATAPGTGPRHSKFSADGRFFYVINELACTIVAYAVDRTTGALAPRQTVSTLPPDFAGESICAEIQLGPDDRFVYGANRGHDSLAVFARDAVEGTLTPVEVIPCGGRHPRHFSLSPDGRWLVCANRDSNHLAAFRVDATTGRLAPSGRVTEVPSPTCVLFPGRRG